MTPPPPSPPPPPITEDILCMQCRYNLRTRTAADRCPECGLPIAQTLTHLRESAGIFIDRRAFYLGSLVCFGLCIAGAALYAAEAFLDSPWSRQLGPDWFGIINPLAMHIAYLVFLVAVITALALLSASVSARIISAGARSLTLIVTIILAAMTAPQALAGLNMLARRWRFVGPGFRAARASYFVMQHRVGVALICTLLLAVGFVCLRRLGRALADHPLQRFTAIMSQVMLAQTLLPVAVLALTMHWNGRRALFGVDSSVFFAPDFFSAICLVLFAWYWWTLAQIGRADVMGSAGTTIPGAPAPRSSAEKTIADFLARRRT